MCRQFTRGITALNTNDPNNEHQQHQQEQHQPHQQQRQYQPQAHNTEHIEERNYFPSTHNPLMPETQSDCRSEVSAADIWLHSAARSVFSRPTPYSAAESLQNRTNVSRNSFNEQSGTARQTNESEWSSFGEGFKNANPYILPLVTSDCQVNLNSKNTAAGNGTASNPRGYHAPNSQIISTPQQCFDFHPRDIKRASQTSSTLRAHSVDSACRRVDERRLSGISDALQNTSEFTNYRYAVPNSNDTTNNGKLLSNSHTFCANSNLTGNHENSRIFSNIPSVRQTDVPPPIRLDPFETAWANKRLLANRQDNGVNRYPFVNSANDRVLSAFQFNF